MNSFNYMSNRNLELLNILKSVDLKKITKKEINFFKNKKILITGVSGIIGINLLFFFDALINKKKLQSKLMEPTTLLYFYLLKIILRKID